MPRSHCSSTPSRAFLTGTGELGWLDPETCGCRGWPAMVLALCRIAPYQLRLVASGSSEPNRKVPAKKRLDGTLPHRPSRKVNKGVSSYACEIRLASIN